MSFEFPYQYGYIDNRKIPYPIVNVELKTVRGYRKYAFIMDTGADELTMPYFMMELLGFTPKQLKISQAQGVGKKLVNTWAGETVITINDQHFKIHCSFTDNNQTPLLLGKQGIFDHFNIFFDNDKQITVFQERKT